MHSAIWRENEEINEEIKIEDVSAFGSLFSIL